MQGGGGPKPTLSGALKGDAEIASNGNGKCIIG